MWVPSAAERGRATGSRREGQAASSGEAQGPGEGECLPSTAPSCSPHPQPGPGVGQEALENGGTRSGQQETALATPPARPIPRLQGPASRLSHLPRPRPQGGRYLLWSASRAPQGTGCERGKRPGQGSASLARRPAEERSRIRAPRPDRAVEGQSQPRGHGAPGNRRPPRAGAGVKAGQVCSCAGVQASLRRQAGRA